MARRTAPKRALVMQARDNVATLVEAVRSGEEVSAELDEESRIVRAGEEIPFGFKIALEDIPEGGDVIKYGELIGRASASIGKGRLVHVHNVVGTRGRGDLEEV